MFRKTALLRLGLVAALVAVLAVGCGAAVAQEDTTAIDDEHGLATDGSISEYHATGSASTELQSVDAELTIGTKKEYVGADHLLTPTNTRNNFVRIEYREDFSRTLRIHIPRDYQTPYTMSGVESATSTHAAEFRPARAGQYLEVVVRVDGPADIVLPIQKDSSITYKGVEYADRRIELITGISPRGSEDWKYVDGDEIASQPAYELPGNPNDTIVQYDDQHHDPEETWLNAPKGEAGDAKVYWSVRENDAGEERGYVYSTDDEDVPSIRYKTSSSESDKWLGEARDAARVPERIAEFVGWGSSDGETEAEA